MVLASKQTNNQHIKTSHSSESTEDGKTFSGHGVVSPTTYNNMNLILDTSNCVNYQVKALLSP